MSDRARRTVSLDAGHRKESKKDGVAKALGAPIRLIKSAASTAWAAWDRGYEAAVARPVHSVKVLGVVVAVTSVLAGLAWFQTDHYSRLNAARAEAVSEGEGAVGRLLSYNFRSMDRQVEKTQDLVTGKFKDDYDRFMSSQITNTAKNKQVAVQTSVDRSAVVSSSLNDAVLLMYVNTESEALLSSAGGNTLSGLRVTLEKQDGKWKVSDLTPV